MKLSITLLCIISDASPKYNIIWIENSEMVDSFISEILKYKSSVIERKTLGQIIHAEIYVYFLLNNINRC